jgi:hypothetical protein
LNPLKVRHNHPSCVRKNVRDDVTAIGFKILLGFRGDRTICTL